MPPHLKHAGIVPMQAKPIQTLVVYNDESGRKTTDVIRRWETSRARACAFCPSCSAEDGPDGQSICRVKVVGRLPESDAPLLRIVDVGGGRWRIADALGRDEVPVGRLGTLGGQGQAG